MTTKQNPKHIQAQKDGKIPLEFLVTSMFPLDAAVHKHGADKYGVRNWRIDEILASTYEGAMMRHLFAWIAGEDLDPDSGKPHLTHLRACCAVVLDAQMHDKLVDDRGRAESKGQPPAAAADLYSYPGSPRDYLGRPLVQDPLSRGAEPGHDMGAGPSLAELHRGASSLDTAVARHAAVADLYGYPGSPRDAAGNPAEWVDEVKP